jgi:ribonucleoside-diphosphate reductase alpha chain
MGGDRNSHELFEAELAHLLITQKGAFNSPVWFNCGLSEIYGIRSGSGGNFAWDPATKAPGLTSDSYSRPQCSACFINSVDDTMDSILQLARTEGLLFNGDPARARTSLLCARRVPGSRAVEPHPAR